ncbi:MAG: hypothetical protein WC648_04400 [Candidatus Paceibacterota bacterium]|jgi:hypothetical protein
MATIDLKFIADSSGDLLLFKSDGNSANISVDNISLKEVITDETGPNFSVKEFLSGTTDEGDPIFFRADSQQLQLNQSFEVFSTPLAIVNRTQRGNSMKCFVALDDGDYYELQGTVSKGVSTLKIHSIDKSNIPSPPLAREIRISWRDSSKQLCRLIQTSIIFSGNTMDITE